MMEYELRMQLDRIERKMDLLIETLLEEDGEESLEEQDERGDTIRRKDIEE